MRYLKRKDDGYIYPLTQFLEQVAQDYPDEFEIVEIADIAETPEDADDVVDAVLKDPKNRKRR